MNLLLLAAARLAEGEGAVPLVGTPQGGGAEETIINAVQWLRLGVEALGAAVIGLGVAVAVYLFARALAARRVDNYNRIRLTLARHLALALEFQLGADILSTAIAPSWDQIGKLGAIAVIRTGLNYFLMREMAEAREGGEGEVESGVGSHETEVGGRESGVRRREPE